MHIHWLGSNCLKITSRDTIIVLDPYGKKTGLRLNSLKADIVISSNFSDIDIKRVAPNKKEIFVIDSAGEYQLQEITIYGIKSDQSILYTFEIEKIKFAHLAGLHRELNEKELNLIEGVDIVMIPVGGKEVLKGNKADSVISQIEPRIVIPMDYKIPGLKIEREPVTMFCKEMGVNESEDCDKLLIKKKDLPEEEMRVVLLKA